MEIDRRTLTRGAVWSLPVVSMATAAPAFAASVAPTCPTCLSATGGAFTYQATVVGNQTTALSSGQMVFNLDSSACGLGLFNPAYTVLPLTNVTVGWTNGVTQNFAVEAIVGAGTFGAVSAFTFNFSGPTNQVSVAGTNEPTTVSITFTAVFVSITGISISCPMTATFDIDTVRTGALVLGAGTYNYTDPLSPGVLS